MEINEKYINSIEKQILELETKGLSFEEVISVLINRRNDKEIKTLPVSIFKNKFLSALETIVKYLKENLNLNYKEIATLLDRNYDPIAVTYRNSKKKMPQALDDSSEEKIPLDILRNKQLSVLENITVYLKEKLNRTYHEIALQLNRDDRTIWTVYKRSTKKRK